MKKLEIVHEVKGKRFLFKVETSPDQTDYQKYEDLRYEIWVEPEDSLPGPRNMVCENYFKNGSALFLGVYLENDEGLFNQDKEYLVGFSYGYVGVKDREIGFRRVDNLIFFSLYTGVKEDFLHFGLGVLIKDFQRKMLMEVFGIYTVSCTYDPLTGINAYRNIHRFGMEIVEYKEAHYGEFGGKLNRVDIPCDRFYVFWDLKKEIQRPEYDLKYLIDSDHLALSSEMTEVQGHSGSVELEIAKEVNLDLDHEFMLIEIPFDFYKMLWETDVSENKIRRIPLEWRMRTRKAFQSLLKREYRIIDFRWIERDNRKRDFYVLKR